MFYADKLMIIGNSKNVCVFNFAILLKLRKFDARKSQNIHVLSNAKPIQA